MRIRGVGGFVNDQVRGATTAGAAVSLLLVSFGYQRFVFRKSKAT